MSRISRLFEEKNKNVLSVYFTAGYPALNSTLTIMKALQDAEIVSRLKQQGADPLGSTPEEYGNYLRGELDRWTKVIKTAGVKPE